MPLVLVKSLASGFVLELAAGWLLANPLSAAALADEALAWQRIGMSVRIKRRATRAVAE